MSVFWTTALLALSIDQLSKFLALGNGAIVLNEGVSWGMRLANGQEKLINIVFILGVFWWWKNHAPQGWVYQASWGLLLGAGLSNTLDRFLYGGVIDWWRWEIFGFTNNLADVLIFLAVIGIIAGELKKH